MDSDPAPTTALHRGRISRHRESRRDRAETRSAQGTQVTSGAGPPGSAGWIARAEREARWASQCVTSWSYAAPSHQLDQLGLAADVQRLRCVVRLGVAGAVPVEVVPAGSPAAPVVLRDRDLGVGRAVLQLDGAEGTPDRQLPAHVGLGLERVPALTQGQRVQRAPGAALPVGGEVRAVVEDARLLAVDLEGPGLALAVVVELDPVAPCAPCPCAACAATGRR